MEKSLDDFIKEYDKQSQSQPQTQTPPQQEFSPDMGALADPNMVNAAGEMVMAPAAIAGYPLAKATEYAGKGLNYIGGPFAYRPEVSFGNLVRRSFGQPDKPGEQAPTTGEMIAEVGSFAAMPKISQVVSPIAGKIAKAVTDKFPRWLVESALKVPPSVPEDMRRMAVGKVLEGYTPTYKHYYRAMQNRRANYKEIEKLIDEGTKSGKTLDTDKILTHLDNVRADWKNMDLPSSYLKEIDEYAKEFRKERGQSIPMNEAQELKKKLYKVTQDDWKPQKISTLKKDMWKEISLGVKEGLEEHYPQLKSLNKTDADYKNFMTIVERAIHRIRNYDVVRMGDVISASAGAAAEGPAGLGIGYLAKRVIEAPLVKSKLAQLLKKAEGASIGLTKFSRMAAGLGAAQIHTIMSQDEYNEKISPNSMPSLDDFMKKYDEGQ